MSNNLLKNQLENIGFNKNESSVFLALLELGLSSSGPIIKKTGLHRNIVYETLNKLITKKIVAESDQRGVKHFKVLNINKILSEKEKEYNLAKEIVLKLEEIKKRENIEIIVYEGEEGFQTALINAVNYIKERHSNLVMGAGGENFYKAMGDAIKTYDKIRKKKNIFSKMIGYEYQRNEHKKSLTTNRPLVEFRYLPNNLFNPSGTVIFDDKILLQIYSSPPAVVEIKSKEVSESYKNYFNLLWEIAKS